MKVKIAIEFYPQEEASEQYNPEVILQERINALAEILGCTDEEAEHLYFEHRE